jgi:hypothetical protein
MMGIVCDSDHKPLIYDPKASDYTIPNGIFVCKNKKVFDVTNSRMIERSGKDLPTFQAQMNEENKEYLRKKKERLAAEKAAKDAKITARA